MIKKEKVAAVVVTYNRKELLQKTIEGLLNQSRPLDGIFIIDNASTDGTKAMINKKYPQLKYLRLKENTGGAGGFHYGLKLALQENYNWFWLMDDDVEPVKKGLERIMSYRSFADCIHPSRKLKNGKRIKWAQKMNFSTGIRKKISEPFENNNFVEVNVGCFEGMFINRELVEKIGLPDPRFFITYDDITYGFLASRYGKNIFIKDIALIKLREKEMKKKDILGISFYKLSDFQLYYTIRNRFLFFEYLKNHGNLDIGGYIVQFLKFIKFYLDILVFPENRIKRTNIFFKAVWDGLLDNWGKTF